MTRHIKMTMAFYSLDIRQITVKRQTMCSSRLQLKLTNKIPVTSHINNTNVYGSLTVVHTKSNDITRAQWASGQPTGGGRTRSMGNGQQTVGECCCI